MPHFVHPWELLIVLGHRRGDLRCGQASRGRRRRGQGDTRVQVVRHGRLGPGQGRGGSRWRRSSPRSDARITAVPRVTLPRTVVPVGRDLRTTVIPAKRACITVISAQGDLCTTVVPAQAGTQGRGLPATQSTHPHHVRCPARELREGSPQAGTQGRGSPVRNLRGSATAVCRQGRYARVSARREGRATAHPEQLPETQGLSVVGRATNGAAPIGLVPDFLAECGRGRFREKCANLCHSGPRPI